MLYLHGRNHSEGTRHLGKILLLGNGGEGGVEYIPLLTLTLGCGEKIFEGRADNAGGVGRIYDCRLASFEELEEYLGVLLFLRRCFVEYGCNLLVTLFAGTLGEECVAVACLRLSGKSL